MKVQRMDENSTFSPYVDLLKNHKATPFHRFLFYNKTGGEEDFSSYQQQYSPSFIPNQGWDIDDSTTEFGLDLSENCTDQHAMNGSRQPNLDDPKFDLDLYIGGYATLVTACFGLTLNTTGIYLLSRRKGYRNMFNLLLILNLVFDTIYLSFQTLRSLHTHFISFKSNTSMAYYIISNSGERFTYISSVLTLIALAHSRYRAVTNPYQGRRIHLSWSKKRKQLLKYFIPIIFFATCFTIPVIFEIDTVTVTTCEGKIDLVVPSKTRLNIYYSILLIGGLNIMFLGLFTFCILIYFTYYILKSLKQRLILLQSNPLTESIKSHCNNRKASKTLFLMVSTFLLLHALRFVTNVGEFIVLLGKNKRSNTILQFGGGIPRWLEIVMILGNICMVINASINYLIYLFLNSSQNSNPTPVFLQSIMTTIMTTVNANQTSTSSRKGADNHEDNHSYSEDEKRQKTVSTAVVLLNNTHDCSAISKDLIVDESSDVRKIGIEMV